MPPANRLNPVRAASSQSLYSLHEFLAEFPDDNACLEYLWRTRHSADGETAHCPKCDQDRTFKRYATAQRRQSWTCTACGHHVHPTAGTIFHKSSTSLHLWFYAMYLITSTRCGISAKHLERELGVHYKTAWRMFNKIRNQLMAEDGLQLPDRGWSLPSPMNFPVEDDRAPCHGAHHVHWYIQEKPDGPWAHVASGEFVYDPTSPSEAR